jgi:hypothetical protein
MQKCIKAHGYYPTKGRGWVQDLLPYPVADNRATGEQAGPTSFMVQERNVETPSFSRKGKLAVRKADRTVGTGGWKKRTLFCNGADTG